MANTTTVFSMQNALDSPWVTMIVFGMLAFLPLRKLGLIIRRYLFKRKVTVGGRFTPQKYNQREIRPVPRSTLSYSTTTTPMASKRVSFHQHSDGSVLREKRMYDPAKAPNSKQSPRAATETPSPPHQDPLRSGPRRLTRRATPLPTKKRPEEKENAAPPPKEVKTVRTTPAATPRVFKMSSLEPPKPVTYTPAPTPEQGQQQSFVMPQDERNTNINILKHTHNNPNLLVPFASLRPQLPAPGANVSSSKKRKLLSTGSPTTATPSKRRALTTTTTTSRPSHHFMLLASTRSTPNRQRKRSMDELFKEFDRKRPKPTDNAVIPAVSTAGDGSSTNQSFQFGAAAAQQTPAPADGSKPSFQFGAAVSTTAPADGSTKPAAVAAAPTAAAPTDGKPAFQFGGATAPAPAPGGLAPTAAKPAIQFGGATPATPAPGTIPAVPADGSSKPQAVAFASVAPATVNAATTTAPTDGSTKPTFQFGASAPTGAPAAAAAQQTPLDGSSKPAAVAFGNATTTQATTVPADGKPAFQFGGTTAPAPANASGGPAPVADTKPTFQFGGATATATAPIQATQAPASNQAGSTAPPAAPVFQFGGRATPTPAPMGGPKPAVQFGAGPSTTNAFAASVGRPAASFQSGGATASGSSPTFTETTASTTNPYLGGNQAVPPVATAQPGFSFGGAPNAPTQAAAQASTTAGPQHTFGAPQASFGAAASTSGPTFGGSQAGGPQFSAVPPGGPAPIGMRAAPLRSRGPRGGRGRARRGRRA